MANQKCGECGQVFKNKKDKQVHQQLSAHFDELGAEGRG